MGIQTEGDLDDIIRRIDKRIADCLGKQHAERAFARARHADQNNITHKLQNPDVE